jgi:hypothetical protein
VVASLVFLTPFGALVALAALLPLAAARAGRRRVDAVRRALGLDAPARPAGAVRLAALVAGLALLGLAAAQPVLTSHAARRIRPGVQALFVLDTSRSMAASRGPTTPTRLDRASAAAERLRAAIPDVESGVATLTDRVLPSLLPVADVSGFDGVVSRAVAIESPPPLDENVRATTFDALTSIPAGGYFDPSAKRRIVVLLTDGESRPIDSGSIARALRAGPGIDLAVVRVGGARESVYGPGGRRDPAYRPDPTARSLVDGLAAAARGRAFEESGLGAAAGYLRSRVGNGPTRIVRGEASTRRPLAPFVALAGLLALVLAGGLGSLQSRRAHVRWADR